MDYRGMAIDKVRYVGEPVAVISATDRYKAEDALDFIRVEYEPLEAVIDPVAAEQPGAPILHDAAGTNVMLHRKFTHGEPAEAFAAAPRETEFTIRYPRNSITPMETYAVVAEYLPDAQSFDVISQQGLNNPGLVAKGISVALITTAGGLMVAVMVLPFYNFFTTRISAYIREMETTANILLETHDQVRSK